MKKVSQSKFKTKDSDIARLKRKKRKKTLKICVITAVVLPVAAIAIAICAFAIWAQGVNIDRDKLPAAGAVATFYDANGNMLPGKQDSYVLENELTENLVHAFVAVEDKRFFEHKGYDPIRIVGAVFGNLKEGKVVEGASTITQQLIKNTHLSHERTLARKLRELALAADLEKEYSKDEIMRMYLSVIYFGKSCYGVKDAARRYFKKDIANLTLAECAALAGVVKNPAKYSPELNPENSLQRRNLVLSLMCEQGYISSEECESAKSKPLFEDVHEDDETMNAASVAYYLKKAEEEVTAALGITRCQLDNLGIKIYTNLQPNLQQTLENYRSDDSFYENKDVHSMSIAIDNRLGAVIGISSTLPYDVSRQAGSVIKPLAVYAPAFDRRLVTLATPIVDEKIDYSGYSPSNFGDVYYGKTTVREAIKKSMNSVSVKLMNYLGSDIGAQYLSDFGITLDNSDASLSLALGATKNGVDPLQIASAYSALANGGVYSPAKFVRYIVIEGKKRYLNGYNDNFVEVFQGKNATSITAETHVGRRVVSEAAAALTTIALADTVKDGTAKTLSSLPIPVAAKTGTAQREDGKNSDAWLVSYNTDYTVLVWHGSDVGFSEKGGGLPTLHASRIWKWLNDNSALSASLDFGDSVIGIDVDTYSSSQFGQTVAACENTPSEYRKLEYFDVENRPDDRNSMFGAVPSPTFEVRVENGVVAILFDTFDIYNYEIYREDLLGRTLAYALSGDGEIATVKDFPLTLGGTVRYTLRVKLKNKPELFAEQTRLVYIDMPY